MFGFLFYPVFWWISATWDRVTERMRYKSARKRFIKEMTGRVRAYAPTAPAAPQPQAATPAEVPAAPAPSAEPAATKSGPEAAAAPKAEGGAEPAKQQ